MVALILFICITLAQNAIVDLWSVVLMLAGLAILLFTKSQPYVLVIAGFVLGLLRVLILS